MPDLDLTAKIQSLRLRLHETPGVAVDPVAMMFLKEMADCLSAMEKQMSNIEKTARDVKRRQIVYGPIQ